MLQDKLTLTWLAKRRHLWFMRLLPLSNALGRGLRGGVKLSRCFLVCILILLSLHTPAQDEVRLILPRERVNIHSGPGTTYPPINRLAWRDRITIIERNHAGNWVHIHIQRNAQTELNGWVQTGHLILDESIHFSQIPVTSELPDADLSTLNSRSMTQLYAVPVLSGVSDAMISVFQRGQALGNHANVVTKIGDSISTSPVYLAAMSQPNPQLGAYDYLSETVAYYGLSSALPSTASQVGMTTYSVFDPLWADPEQCQPNETPLTCEYHLKKPAIAFILFGQNDVRAMDEAHYEAQMRLIIEQSLESGVIPILNTFSAHPDDDLWPQALSFNIVLIQLAAEYQVPLINFWAAARDLPDYGLDEDGVHPKHSGFSNLYFVTGHEAYYGISLLNLLSLNMLHDIHQKLRIND
jgi:hypothetical protein